MQDRFKFRCWDKVQQQMHYDDFIITSVGKIHKPFPSSLEMGTIQGNDDELAYRYLQFDQAENNDNSVIVMQCTSKKDKNGKLIYEGDLLRVNTGSRDTSGYGVVEYEQSGCNFIVTGYLDNPSGYHPRKKGEFFQKLEEWLCTEIIGNIYENPELLEEK